MGRNPKACLGRLPVGVEFRALFWELPIVGLDWSWVGLESIEVLGYHWVSTSEFLLLIWTFFPSLSDFFSDLDFLFPEFFLPWSLGTSCSVLTSMAAPGARFLVAGIWSTPTCCRLDSCSFEIWVWWNFEFSVDSFFICVRRFWYQISTCNSKCKICTKMPFGFR